MKKHTNRLAEAEWDFEFPSGKAEEAATALCWEWEFTRELNRENQTLLRGTNAWSEQFGHDRNIPFFQAVPEGNRASLWREIESAWFEVGAIEFHEGRIFPWFFDHNPFRGMERETSQTLHRKNNKGQIVETAHYFPIRWEVPEKFILQEIGRWLEHHRKEGFPGGKVLKARRQKPWVQLRQTELRELGIYRAWKHHGKRFKELETYICFYKETANYSHAVKRTKQRLQSICDFLREHEQDGPRFLY